MDEIQTTLNDSQISARLFEPSHKTDKDLKLILRELRQYRKLKRAAREKRGI